jgi:hypothetical protein
LCGRLRLPRSTTGLLATTKLLQHPLDVTAVWVVSAVPLVAMLTTAAVVVVLVVAAVPMRMVMVLAYYRVLCLPSFGIRVVVVIVYETVRSFCQIKCAFTNIELSVQLNFVVY